MKEEEPWSPQSQHTGGKARVEEEEPLSLMARKFLYSGGQAWEQDPDYDNNAFRKEHSLFT
jgi:hypothetical protein